ncbi:MAG: formylglycine-generating enzyme family protein [Pseudomonadota bacterium]
MREFGASFRGSLAGLNVFGDVQKSAFSFFVAIFLLMGSNVGAEPFDRFQDCDVCPEMIELPLGSFMAGTPDDEFVPGWILVDGNLALATPETPVNLSYEKPQVHVTIDIPFAMSKYEITVGQYRACLDDGGCGGRIPRGWVYRDGFTRGKLYLEDDHPVLNISVFEAIAYTEWLNEKLGTDAYRLPTEVEWEYAARAGTTTPFPQGDRLTDQQANFSGPVTEAKIGPQNPPLKDRGLPVKVTELDAANPWGLWHMEGNAGEYTLSCFSDFQRQIPKSSGWLEHTVNTGCSHAVSKGTTYNGSMFMGRPSARMRADTSSMTKYDGFRVLKELTDEQ